MKMLKVLFIIPDFARSGTNASLLALINHRNQLSLNPSVYALADEGDFKENFTDCLIGTDRLLSAYYSDLRKAKGIKRLVVGFVKGLKYLSKRFHFARSFNLALIDHAVSRLEIDDFDVLVAFQEGDPTYVAATIRHGRKIAWIHGAHDSDYHKTAPDLSAYEKFNAVACVCKHSCESFMQIYPTLKDKVHLILNYVDYERINRLKNGPIASGVFDSSKFAIVSVGRISQVKRFCLIPEIAHKLIERGLEFRWYLCGPVVDQDQYDKLIAGIARYSLEDRVFFLGSQSNPFPYYYRSNVFVSLSRSEANSMVFHEARVCGLPIVSADFPTAVESLKGYEYGFVADLEHMPDVIERVYHSRLKPEASSDSFFENYNAGITAAIIELFSK